MRTFLKKRLFFLVIEHAMAVALIIGVGDLRFEFLADALILLLALQTARAVATCALEPLFDLRDDLGIGI